MCALIVSMQYQSLGERLSAVPRRPAPSQNAKYLVNIQRAHRTAFLFTMWNEPVTKIGLYDAALLLKLDCIFSK